MTPEQTYLANLATIERIAAFVARRKRLNPDEAAEFTQEVRVRLLDDDYAIIRKFRGQSAFSTYLTTVIVRLQHQWRVEQWGKWRPSAEAKRIGERAILVERLLTRDGYTFGEVVSLLTTPAGSGWTAQEIESIHLRLPERSPRPILVRDDASPEVLSVEADALDRVEGPERESLARKAALKMDDLLEGMNAEDRLILQLRFWDCRKVPEIARLLHVEQKKIYKRLDKLFQQLRSELEQAGVTRDAVASLLSRGDQEISLPGEGIHPAGLSNGKSDAGRLPGEGRLP